MKPSVESFIILQKSLPKSKSVKLVISMSFTNLMDEGGEGKVGRRNRRKKGGRIRELQNQTKQLPSVSLTRPCWSWLSVCLLQCLMRCSTAAAGLASEHWTPLETRQQTHHTSHCSAGDTLLSHWYISSGFS